MRKLATAAVTTALLLPLTFSIASSASAAGTDSFGIPKQDVLSPDNYVAEGTQLTTNPQTAPVSATSA